MIILDEAKPTIEQIRSWGFDEEMYLMEQDEDLLLHDVAYLPILIELAANQACPKQKYCEAILEYFVQLQFLCRADYELAPINAAIIAAEKLLTTDWLKNWRTEFDFLYSVFKNPRKLTFHQCEKIARILNIGNYGHRKIMLNRKFKNGVLEFKAFYGKSLHFFYINPRSGNWKISKFDRLKDFT